VSVPLWESIGRAHPENSVDANAYRGSVESLRALFTDGTTATSQEDDMFTDDDRAALLDCRAMLQTLCTQDMGDPTVTGPYGGWPHEKIMVTVREKLATGRDLTRTEQLHALADNAGIYKEKLPISLKKKPQAWQFRKIAYGLAAVIIGVLAWISVLSNIQADQVTDQVDKWLQIQLGVLAPALAATKIYQGSDSTATEADAAAASLLGSAHDVADIVVQQVKAVTPQDVASAVLSAIRAEERGEHGTVKTAAASADYVYGR